MPFSVNVYIKKVTNENTVRQIWPNGLSHCRKRTKIALKVWFGKNERQIKALGRPTLIIR